MTQGVLDLTTVRRSWINDHKPVVMNYARIVDKFTTDDLHPLFHPEPSVPNWIGCLIRQLARSGSIRSIGYTQSKRPVSNGRAIAVWTIADKSPFY
jgi:hypothetical protein